MLKDGSEFLRTKLEGECAVREEFPEATIIRPSDIWGQEDRFLRVFSGIWRQHLGYIICAKINFPTQYKLQLLRSDNFIFFYRKVPLWKKGEHTEKQPVAVYDVAGGITAIAKDPKNTAGKTYQFVG